MIFILKYLIFKFLDRDDPRFLSYGVYMYITYSFC